MKEQEKMEEKFVCWINEKEMILSLHYEDGYAKKEFQSQIDYKKYLLYVASVGYRIQ